MPITKLTSAAIDFSAGTISVGSGNADPYGGKLSVSETGQATAFFWNQGVGSGHVGIGTGSANLKLYNTYATGLLSGGRGIDIDVDGRVLMPYQPVASVSYGGGDIAATAIISLNNTPIVQGGMTVASNRITVPVTGTYIVGYHHLGTSTGCQIEIRRNGAAINSGAGARTQINPASNHGNGSVQNPVAMNANDYFEFYVVNSTLHGNAGYNRMYAYLIA